MSEQSVGRFFESKTLRRILLVVLAILVLAGNTLGRSKMTLAREEVEQPAAPIQMVEAR